MTEYPLGIENIEPPSGRRTPPWRMEPIPKKNPSIVDCLRNRHRTALVDNVCSANDHNRLSHEEWLLAGDGDVSSHKYVKHENIIYSIVWVD